MGNLKTSSHIRSILKGISWRVIATADTVIVVLLVTCFFCECSLTNAIAIGAAEFFFKLAVYYFHERAWLSILKKQATTKGELIKKSISWRVVATTVTFIISGLVLESFDKIALTIAVTELFTKFILYYFHEKIWLLLPLGRVRNFFLQKKRN